jgi:hypothetical protein
MDDEVFASFFFSHREPQSRSARGGTRQSS